MILNKEVDIDKLNSIKDTNTVRDELLKLSGVGPKVADCILLFSTLKRFDVFPIDVWVRRVMNDLYIHKKDEKKVSKKEILSLANNKFGNLEGIAQQYLFYWRREIRVKWPVPIIRERKKNGIKNNIWESGQWKK